MFLYDLRHKLKDIALVHPGGNEKKYRESGDYATKAMEFEVMIHDSTTGRLHKIEHTFVDYESKLVVLRV